MRDELKNDLKGGEGFGSPVDRNEGKESMFDLVPTARLQVDNGPR
jgi:hypothetical protein